MGRDDGGGGEGSGAIFISALVKMGDLLHVLVPP
jgi:hypothetical protein